MIQKNHPSFPVLIVGAGLSGLTCALRLHQAGIPVHVIEASDGVGGRVRTDRVDGFLLDRGFQVYLSAYPQASEFFALKRNYDPEQLFQNQFYPEIRTN